MMKKLLLATLLMCYFLLESSTLFAQTSASLNATARNFLNTLSAEQLKVAKYSFTDSARTKWTNLPVGMVPRSGIQYGSLSDSSRIAFHHVLTTMLSSRGYLKITSIMQL